jgi:dihydrofolate reductase
MSHPVDQVFANIVVGSDGCTTLHGTSAGLSSPEDRRRFHALRSTVDYLLIGGNTARTEPYKKTPVPLIVMTRGEMPHEVASNPLARKVSGSIQEVLENLQGVVLVEAGPSILGAALKEKLIDKLFVTVTKMSSNENCINIIEFTEGYVAESREVVGDEEFITFTPSK